MRRTKIAIVILITFGVILCIVYTSIIPMLVTIAVVLAMWTWNWHRMVYLNPKLVIVDQSGITMEFRYGGKKRFVPWPNVTGLWISTKPNTVAQAVVECVGMRAVFVTKEIGLAVQQKYREVMGRDAPEWI
jgi:hypothetical protein